MEKRSLGRTRHNGTILAGGALFISKPRQREVETLMNRAFDRGGITLMAPTYGDAELRLGRWVKEYRGPLFLACKTLKRTRKDAAEELQPSLKRLQADHFDLYQLHALDKLEELETALGPNGSLQAILEAKKQGFVKYVGIASHDPIIITRL